MPIADVPFRLVPGSVLPVRENCRLLRRRSARHCGRGKAACACGGTEGPLDGTAAPFYYEGTVRSGILQFKKGCRPYAAEEYARMMALVVRREYGESRFDGIAAVPSGRAAMKRRGFNPTQAIAEELASVLICRFCRCL